MIKIYQTKMTAKQFAREYLAIQIECAAEHWQERYEESFEGMTERESAEVQRFMSEIKDRLYKQLGK